MKITMKPLHRLTQACLLLVALVVVDTVTSHSAFAQPGNGNGNGNDISQQRGNQNAGASLNIDVAAIRQLAVNNRMTGYQSLPPGIQRNLARGKALPPGIARKHLPPQMMSALPVVAGHEWQVVGQDLLLVEMGSLLVVEILSSVFH